MASNINIDSNFNKKLNEYLSTEDGAKQAVKILPVLLGGFMNSADNNISALSQQVISSLSNYQQLADDYFQSKQYIQEQDMRIAKLESILGIKGQDNINNSNNNNNKPVAPVMPTQPISGQGGDLADLSNLLSQLRNHGSSSTQAMQ